MIQSSNLKMVSDSKLDVILRGQNLKFFGRKGIFVQNKVLKNEFNLNYY